MCPFLNCSVCEKERKPNFEVKGIDGRLRATLGRLFIAYLGLGAYVFDVVLLTRGGESH